MAAGAKSGAPAKEEKKEHENHFFVGVNGVAAAVFTEKGTESALGGGAFFEFTAIEHSLEIEAAVHVLTSGGHLEVPVDVLLKMPFHPARWVTLYVGLGPAVLPVLNYPDGNGGTKTKIYAGLANADGAYFWLRPHFGISAEVNYNLLFGEGTVKNELGVAAGPVFGW